MVCKKYCIGWWHVTNLADLEQFFVVTAPNSTDIELSTGLFDWYDRNGDN